MKGIDVAIRKSISDSGETFGTRVSRLRHKQGASKSALAKAVGVSTTCVWNWEEGNTHPRLPALFRLADALNTTPEHLREGDIAADAEINTASSCAVPDTFAKEEVSLADLIQWARRAVAASAGLSAAQVRIVLDYGG